MRKNKSLSSTAPAVRFDLSSKPVQGYAQNARKSSAYKATAENPTIPHHDPPDELSLQGKMNLRNKMLILSQAEKEINKQRENKPSRTQNTPISEKEFETRNTSHSKKL